MIKFLALCLVVISPVHAKSMLEMTQEERRAAHLARQEAAHPMDDRARWACSDMIEQRLHVPDSVKWTRRSTWPSVQIDGVWHVSARYTARNRMGQTLPSSAVCKMRYSNGRWTLIR